VHPQTYGNFGRTVAGIHTFCCDEKYSSAAKYVEQHKICQKARQHVMDFGFLVALSKNFERVSQQKEKKPITKGRALGRGASSFSVF
jgi:hypothetical protein